MKTLTFTVEDALLSPIGFAVLSGAGLFKDALGTKKVHVHTTANAFCSGDGTIELKEALDAGAEIDTTAPVFVIITEEDGSLGEVVTGCSVSGTQITGATAAQGKNVFVDFYVAKDSKNVSELQIDMGKFGGYYYVEASTLFRRQADGVDMPAEITFPNVKIQSNFTFSMASTGDPSTFTFTMDAMPGYTMFDQTKKVLCVIQVVEDASSATETINTVMGHDEGESDSIAEKKNDSTSGGD